MEQKTALVFKSQFYRFIFLLLAAPLFWWVITQIPYIASEWLKLPSDLHRKVTTLFTIDRLHYVQDLRWESAQYPRNDLLLRLYYNKATILADEFFGYTTFLSPRLYFQAGDGTQLSPPGIEPIPFLYLPFWLAGIFCLISQKKFKAILITFLLAAIAYLAGQKIFAFLFPVAAMYIYFCALGINALIKSSRKQTAFFVVLFIYSFYLIGRALMTRT